MTSNVTLSLVGKQLRLPAFQGRAGGGAVCRPGCAAPQDPAAIFPLEDAAGRICSLSSEPAWRVPVGPHFPPPHPLTAARPVMWPLGMFFIIFPLNLINPHSVMNLEISIEHIITNQHRTGSSWRLHTAVQGSRLGWAASPKPGQRGLGSRKAESDRRVVPGGLSPWARPTPAPPARRARLVSLWTRGGSRGGQPAHRLLCLL